MTEFAYTTVPGKIREVLAKIRIVGVPSKASNSWLKTVGFTSSNDSSLLGVLRFVGLIDSSNIPTSNWSAYRGANYKAVLAEAIRSGYAELFAVYPDANARTNAELSHVFSTSSSAGAQVVSKTVATFKAIVEEADFSGSSQVHAAVEVGPLHTPPATPPFVPHMVHPGGGPALHIDIQIHISPESSAQQIEKIFESMAKHLYGRRDA